MAEEFVENLYTDEIRSTFLVVSHRKKLWNVQIGLINEFARICKKYNLRWFAAFGTLLGAVRHGGFVPWDDDVDLVMLRPEYEKFKQIAKDEIQYPYFFDNWYEYHIETEEPLPATLDPNYQYRTVEDLAEEHPFWLSQWPSIRLRDSRTTFIEFPKRKHIHQGIFIDIFPLDPVPPFEEKSHFVNFLSACELIIAAAVPKRVEMGIEKNIQTTLSHKILKDFLKLPYRERGRIAEEMLAKNFFESKFVGLIKNYSIINNPAKYESNFFDKTITLPFEKIELPAPAKYDEFLKTDYGDWHKLVFSHFHSELYSSDISYKEFFEKVH